MGFLDGLKKVGGLTKELVDYTAKRYKLKKKTDELKIELLMRFKMDDLKKICKIKGISTTYYDDDYDREVEIRRKSDLIDEMMWLSIDDIASFARRYGVKYKDILEELEEFEKQLFEEESELFEDEEVIEEEFTERRYKTSRKRGGTFDKIVEIIKEFELDPVRNEEHFESQLRQFLRGSLKSVGCRVLRQQRIEDSRIDIVIIDEREKARYGIELKIADDRGKLRTLVGQVKEYKDKLDRLLVIILDVGKNVDIEKYKEFIEEEGAEVMILKGEIRRVGRRREIRVIY